MSDIDQMLSNHKAETWNDVKDSDGEKLYDNETVGKLERLQSYVDHCFETFDIVSRYLDREQVQCCIADWGRRRGQARYNTKMKKQSFGKRVSDKKYRQRTSGTHALFIATALVGVEPDEDKGAGWKACVRHELGHLIDYEKHGTSSGHGQKFKNVMRKFGTQGNDGGFAHGYPPRVHR